MTFSSIPFPKNAVLQGMNNAAAQPTVSQVLARHIRAHGCACRILADGTLRVASLTSQGYEIVTLPAHISAVQSYLGY